MEIKLGKELSGMDMYKIIRGAIIGIVAGVVFGLAITRVMTIANNEEAVETFGVATDSIPLEVYDETLQICNKLIRFHVKANSNSKEDLDLKMKVRNAAIYVIADDLSQVKTREEAADVIYGALLPIKEAAEEVVRAEGYDYPVDVVFDSRYFPMRQYADIILPAGTYDALTINIGEAEGENFWCILYPTVCFATDSAAVLDKESKEVLREELTKEEYERIFIGNEEDVSSGNKKNEDKIDIKIGFKLKSLFE